MKIVSLTIDNYRAIEHLELPFSDVFGKVRNITVLAGPNGCGKTSVLFAIVQALRGVTGYRTTDVPVPTLDDMRLRASSGRYTEQPPEIRVDVKLQFDKEEQEAIPELFDILEMDRPPPLPDGRLSVHWTFPPGISEEGKRGSNGTWRTDPSRVSGLSSDKQPRHARWMTRWPRHRLPGQQASYP